MSLLGLLRRVWRKITPRHPHRTVRRQTGTPRPQHDLAPPYDRLYERLWLEATRVTSEALDG